MGQVRKRHAASEYGEETVAPAVAVYKTHSSNMFDVLEDLKEEWQCFSMVKFSISETLWKDHLLIVNATNIQEATAWIDTLVASGGTHYGPAVQKAYNMPLPANVDVTAVCLLSDGEPNDCPDKDSCYQAWFDSKPDVRVRTIALNAASSVKDKLHRISHRTGGDNVDVQVS